MDDNSKITECFNDCVTRDEINWQTGQLFNNIEKATLLKSTKEVLAGRVWGIMNLLQEEEKPSQTTLKMAQFALDATSDQLQADLNSSTDLLTGIASRRAFEESGNLTISRLKRDVLDSAALMFIDVVKFKDFNDKYGHDVGDQALITVANALKNATRETDLVARFAGDEFIVISPFKIEEGSNREDTVNCIRDKVQESTNNLTIEVDGKTIPIGLSIGITELRPNDSLEHGVKRADGDMYKVKADQHAALDTNSLEPE